MTQADDQPTGRPPADPSPAGDDQQSVSVYRAVGGQGYFDALVDNFFQRVENDPVVRTLYPEDLAASIEHTALFLGQYWGGPDTYSQRRGHPRLRARHMPFPIGQEERDHWFDHMMAAVAETTLPEEIATAVEPLFRDYFDRGATAMMNQA